jgi:hypothetical protein
MKQKMPKIQPSYRVDNLQNLEGSAEAFVVRIYKLVQICIVWIRIHKIVENYCIAWYAT